jgi:inorganic pyrophosphatase
MNLLHDIDPGTPEEITAIIEVSKGSSNKYEVDKETGLIKFDRANYSAAPFPAEYGFIPRTLWDDGDAIDVVVLATFPIPSGILIKLRPVGLMEMTDTGENDYKIVCVPLKDKRWDSVKDITDVNQYTLKEIKHFFETYKALKGDEVVIHGFKGKEEAKEAFKKGREMYEASKK